MANYTQNTPYGPKDSLLPGDPDKKILGTQLDAEFAELQTVSATKYDVDSLADNAEARALTSNSVLITPQRLKEALEAPTVTLDLLATTLTTTSTASIGDDLTVSGIGDFTGRLVTRTVADTSLYQARDSSSGAIRWRWYSNASHSELILSGATGSAGSEVFNTAYIVNRTTGRVTFPNAAGSASSDYVTQDRNITAGDGLSGTSTLAADVTLNVGAGNGIRTLSNSISIDTGDGLDYTSDSRGLEVSLASSSGLEFAAGDLRLNAGTLPLVSGASLDTATDYFVVGDASASPNTRRVIIDDLLANTFISRTEGELTLTLDSDFTWTTPVSTDLHYCVWEFVGVGKLVQVSQNTSTINNGYIEFSPTSSDQQTCVLTLDTSEIPRATDDNIIQINHRPIVLVLGTDADEADLIDVDVYMNYLSTTLRVTINNESDFKTTGTYRLLGMSWNYWADA